MNYLMHVVKATEIIYMKYGWYTWEKLCKISKKNTLFLEKARISTCVLKIIEEYETEELFFQITSCKQLDKICLNLVENREKQKNGIDDRGFIYPLLQPHQIVTETEQLASRVTWGLDEQKPYV